MSAMEVGKKLVEYCKQGEFERAIEELYAEDAVHYEAMEMQPGAGRETRGKAAILEGTRMWVNNMEVHESGVSGPYPCDDEIIVPMWSDSTPKAGPMAGNRFKMDEVCKYKVKDGKIVEGRFYYDMGM
ncbi:MAG: SnoaL-like domain-containing protein [Planctomycetota bacterium]